jgi:hypothetical protein
MIKLPQLKPGQTVKLAYYLGYNISTLYNWRRDGIPAKKRAVVAAAMRELHMEPIEIEPDGPELSNRWLPAPWMK